MSESRLDSLLAWIDASPSPYHAAHNATAELSSVGFNRFGPDEKWEESDRVVVSWGGVVIAAAFGSRIDPDRLRFRIVGAHTEAQISGLSQIPILISWDIDNSALRFMAAFC